MAADPQSRPVDRDPPIDGLEAVPSDSVSDGNDSDRSNREADVELDGDVEDDGATNAGSDRSNWREPESPEDQFLIYDRLTRESTLAQDTLGFDYVRDDGIIVDGEDYIGLVEVHPRNWLVLNEEERIAVFRAFASFLLGLKYPIQIVSLPREFDISKHTERIALADSRVERDRESPILRHGRDRHIAWLFNTIDTMSVKDRDFFAVTRVVGDHVTDGRVPDRSTRGGMTGWIVNTISIGRPRLRRTNRTRTEAQCLREVKARQNELAETLTRTGVRTEIVSDRDDAMDVLYRHYNQSESPFQRYNHATYTGLLSNALGTDGID